MSLLRILLGVCCVLSTAAHAAGDAAAGQALAAPCAACHGQNGVAVLPAYPNLAGQGESYLLKQLRLIKSGGRAAPLMAGQLDALTDQDLANLAAHYASLAPTVGQAADERLDVGERIYRGGIASKGVAACTACHSPTGAGNSLAGYPRLGGQPAEYVAVQLKAYREGQRVSDDDLGNVMRQIAAGLTDGEIGAVANYVQGLH
jgi:cytochrome c553